MTTHTREDSLVELFADTDPLAEHLDLGSPFVDVDELRTIPAPHRYVHGGFNGGHTRFSFYFPPVDDYEGRFFQYITPVPESELSSQAVTGEDDRIGFSLASGAYFIETNGGGPAAADPFSGVDRTIGAYRANAACAIFSRQVADAIYGEGRHYGYSFGGSGGGYRTIGGLENTEVWDGAVPFVIGSPMAIPNCFTPRIHALRILGDRLDDVDDAMDAGGSGDPYATLNGEQAAALREVTGMGFPLRSWFGHRSMGMHALAVLYPAVRAMDPTYFDDFWTVPGYLGADRSSSLHRDKVVLSTTIAQLLTVRDLLEAGVDPATLPGASTGNADDSWMGRDTGDVVGVRLAHTPDHDPGFAELVLDAGESSGARIVLIQIISDVAVFGPADPRAIAQIRVEDPVTLDNSGFLAMQTYHRHQVPGPEYTVWDQFRNPDGSPLYPQRPLLVGPMFAAGAAGTIPNGHFNGRMILVESLMDREAYPWQADWYRQRAAEHHSADIDDRFRVWMTDRALHADTDLRDHPDRTINYGGMLQQALRDLAAWVENDVPPPASTVYEVAEGQVIAPETAADRKGIQPTLDLTADGESRVETRLGQHVRLRATAVAADAGEIVRFEWDTDGDGQFDVMSEMAPAATVTDTRSVSFSEPGTHFVTVRVVAQRQSAQGTAFARLYNLARVRVIVR